MFRKTPAQTKPEHLHLAEKGEYRPLRHRLEDAHEDWETLGHRKVEITRKYHFKDEIFELAVVEEQGYAKTIGEVAPEHGLFWEALYEYKEWLRRGTDVYEGR